MTSPTLPYSKQVTRSNPLLHKDTNTARPGSVGTIVDAKYSSRDILTSPKASSTTSEAKLEVTSVLWQSSWYRN